MKAIDETSGDVKISVLNQEISQLKGIVKSKQRKPASLREMKKAIRGSAGEKTL